MTGCVVQLPFHKGALKAVTSSWGIISLTLFFLLLEHLRRALATYSVLPLGVYILFAASPAEGKIPPLLKEDGRSGCLLK